MGMGFLKFKLFRQCPLVPTGVLLSGQLISPELGPWPYKQAPKRSANPPFSGSVVQHNVCPHIHLEDPGKSQSPFSGSVVQL